VQRCHSDYSSSHHDYPASDVFTQIGCAFVAVTSGRVDEVSSVDRWNPQVDDGATRGGLSVSIIGDDGVRYYGSHLERIARGIRPGVRVRAGRLLGLIDNSGDAKYTPTHVHFGISWPTRHGVWWVRRGEVTRRTLDPADVGLEHSPVEALRGADAAHNAQVARDLFAGQHGPVRDAVVLNAGIALAVAADDDGEGDEGFRRALRRGMDRAEEALDSGAVARRLDAWVAATQR
jgi:murein DD-endopeptidase MepM/ murein hydrolase activator NlpD